MSAIAKDTEFLAGRLVMDYSLLVGVDDVTKELVVGIIGVLNVPSFVVLLLFCALDLIAVVFKWRIFIIHTHDMNNCFYL